ncbi:hypothetical protein Dsin_002834 [Dipteronia sinensis]|uniref:Phytocyanin domain-containing protein n=1 Tax=Dipteronia sinensis TaxID=43782 RepID=A0AAE0B6K9_9ROSI|nr:hypothetical protein Dsin_002834 [Dipteronia sinensis]
MDGVGAGFVCAVAVVFCMVVPSCLATVYTVGDTSGWSLGVDYTTWAGSNTVAVGDSIVFNYGSSHSVDEVSASDYKTCTTGNAISSDNTGATTITLKTAGTHYFICGVASHCGSGMKLAVTVGSGSGTGTGTETGSTTPPSSSSSPGGTSTSITPTTKTPAVNTPESSMGAVVSPFVGLLITWVASVVLIFS